MRLSVGDPKLYVGQIDAQYGLRCLVSIGVALYIVATADKMIPPPAQHFMAQRAGATIVEAPGSHAIYVSKPEAVAGLIEQAASAETAAASH